MRLTIQIFLFVLSKGISFAQNFSPKIKAFKAGESLAYDVSYNWGLIWVSAGTVTFSQILSGKHYKLGIPNWEKSTSKSED